MIISASRRTDIPAFYADWFMNRIRAGSCQVANPRNPRQVSEVSLAPSDVEAIVFWSKNPAPLVRHLAELDRLGFRYYFLFTLNDYPVCIEPCVPPLEERIKTFVDLSCRIGKDKVVWRYDPVILSEFLSPDYHRRAFSKIADRLCNSATRVVISVVDFYAKTARRLSALEAATGDRFVRDPIAVPEFSSLISDLSSIAKVNGMRIQGCAEDERLMELGIRPGKCIDDELIRDVLGVSVTQEKDHGQRERCLCVVSRDIGVSDSCAYGCEYCYATSSAAKAMARHRLHIPESPFLIAENGN